MVVELGDKVIYTGEIEMLKNVLGVVKGIWKADVDVEVSIEHGFRGYIVPIKDVSIVRKNEKKEVGNVKTYNPYQIGKKVMAKFKFKDDKFYFGGVISSVEDGLYEIYDSWNDRTLRLPEHLLYPINEPKLSRIDFESKDSPTKPSHYHEGGIDVFDYMKANFTKEEQRGFHKGTAIKYISRAGKKKGNSYEQDIAKAKVHIQELERLGEEG